ncbi:MAG: hypothetical protein SF069_03655 [Phycisphaerae bacterium]|nr:hypothetical protein [Phycisphaerae bacterium]
MRSVWNWIRSTRLTLGLTLATALVPVGCVDLDGDDLEDIVEEIADLFDDSIGPTTFIAAEPTVFPPALVATRPDPVIINNNVTIINDFREDIVVDVVDDINIFVFENATGLDGFYVFLVDGIEQSIFVETPLDGSLSGSLVLEYPCVGSIELLIEEYYDPITGELLDSFDIVDGFFENGFDFFCGEALIFTFDSQGVFAEPTPIDFAELAR